MNNSCLNEAQNAARIESYFSQMVTKFESENSSPNIKGSREVPFVTDDGRKYTILDAATFYRYPGDELDCCVKAIVVRDENDNNKNDNIFLHFNGTGDGNWEFNADNAYGHNNVSYMHQWVKDYTDSVLRDICPNGESIYISGHSQGGNNAQYAVLSAQEQDRIINGISLDGPNFSNSEIEYLKSTMEEEEFQRRVDKLYAYNGNSDYVSVLGQNRIIPDDHTYIVQTNSDGYNTGPNNSFAIIYHMCNYMLNKDGTFGEVKPFNPNDTSDGESHFRMFMRAMMPYMQNFTLEEQNKYAHAIMKMVENATNDGVENVREAELSAEEFEAVKKALIPMVLETIDKHPEEFKGLLNEILPTLIPKEIESATGSLIDSLIDELNNLPKQDSIKLLESLASVLVVKDGKIVTDLNNLNEQDFEYVKQVLSTLALKLVEENPDAIKQLLSILLPKEVYATHGPLINALIDGLNDLSIEDRKRLLKAWSDVVVIKDGKINIEWTRVLGNERIATIVIEAISVLYNTLVNHPDEALAAIEPYKEILIEYAKEHPFETAALAIVFVLNLPTIATAASGIGTLVIGAIGLITAVNLAIDFCNAVFSKLGEQFKALVAFMQNCVLPALQRVYAWMCGILNPGAAYAQSNPFLRIDTGSFHNLAGRISNVNRRLRNLDSALNDLYWQVGLLDIWDLLCSDLLVSCSPTLSCVQNYLSDTASTFESVEGQVQGIFA